MPVADGDLGCHGTSEVVNRVLTKESMSHNTITSVSVDNNAKDGVADSIIEGGTSDIVENVDIETGFSENETSPKSSVSPRTARDVASTPTCPSKGAPNFDIRRVVFSFSLCCLSSIVAHVIRMPLFTTKIEMQHSMNLTTLDLTHLDNFFAISHALGQMTSPIISSKSYNVLFITVHHIIIGSAICFLYATNNFVNFAIVFFILGFVSGPAWAVLFTHLSAWLPEECSFLMITIWFTCTDIGYILGGLLCMYVQLHFNWRQSYIVGGILNILVGLVLFCLHDECKQTEENQAIIDPRSIIERNIEKVILLGSMFARDDPKVDKFIQSEGQAPPPAVDSRREFILSGISNLKLYSNNEGDVDADSIADFKTWGNCAISTYDKAVRGTRRYIAILQRVSYIGRILTACFILMMVKHCFSSWASFYVCTVYHYSVSDGSYVSFMIRLGNCIGNVMSALFCRVYWKDRPLSACMLFCALSSLVVLSFCLLDFSSIILDSICCCLCGTVTSAAEAIMMAKGIKRLCERSQLTQRESVTVYGFLLSITTVGSITQGFLVAYVVDIYGWTVLYAIFVVALVFAAVLLYKPAIAEHNF